MAVVAVLLVLAWSASPTFWSGARRSPPPPICWRSSRDASRRRAARPAARPRVRCRPARRSSKGQTLTVAGAALLQRVADAVTKVGGNVLSSQVDVQGVQAKDGYVSVLASCEIEQAAMQRLLYDLEAGMPFLFVEQFVAQSPQTHAGAAGRPHARCCSRSRDNGRAGR